MTIAIYPGTFDPMTSGHLDIARRAASIFDHVIIAIYDAPAKNVLFSTEERVAMAAKATEGLPNVSVSRYNGLTVDYARQKNARVIVRGLRAMSDFELEMQMALLNRKLAPEIEVVCLMTSLQYSFLSSSIIKEIVSLGGCIEGLVPDHVLVALQQKHKGGGESSPIPRHLNT
ncbi:MAG: pantetheine-phosphate adenylyltransferase [Chloroflexi bacterium]|nr:pantetheine-phosphate adenylyltransferase [Chloroflexota bacterium]MCL5074107.1 pantetheine-phosphate adenylyltransferase [Chloroflexota bacterium]